MNKNIKKKKNKISEKCSLLSAKKGRKLISSQSMHIWYEFEIELVLNLKNKTNKKTVKFQVYIYIDGLVIKSALSFSKVSPIIQINTKNTRTQKNEMNLSER